MNRIGDNLTHTGVNKELVQSLVDKNVQFTVVGGLAVSWYCTDRQANDMDLLVNATMDNSARLADALSSLGLTRFSSNSFNERGLRIPLKEHFYAELLTENVSGPTFAEIAECSVKVTLFDIPVKLASRDMLIRMKDQAANDSKETLKKHLADIECLQNYATK